MRRAPFLRLGEKLRALGLPAVSPSYEALAREASDEVLVTDPSGRVSFTSPTFSRRWDLDRWALVGSDAFDWVVPEDRDAARARLLAACVPGAGPVDSEHRFVVRATGEVRWCQVRFSDARHVRGVGGVIWNARDITEDKRNVEALRHLAAHDPLTGLPNRRELFDGFRAALHAGDDTALLVLSLDGLKLVNDRHGHAVGDEVVCRIAERLADVVGNASGGGGRLHRLDGDEFAVLLRGAEPEVHRALPVLADRVDGAVREPLSVLGRTVAITTSVGTAVLSVADAPADADEAGRQLFQQAGVAVTAAKSGGRDRWIPFSRSLLDSAHDRAELAADLRRALDADGEGLRVLYQPLVDLERSATVGFEALVRWDHPTRGSVPPSVFVAIAEESDTIIALGAFVLDTALAAAADLQRSSGRDDLEISVNLSGHQLRRPGIVDDVAQALLRHGVEPSRLCLEVTESVAVADLSAAGNTLQQLRSLGVLIALDDFGTGYSSLSYLRRLPVDILKIDKSFVDDASNPADAVGAAVLSGIVTLSSALGLVTVAEGIETEQSHAVVRGAGCTWGQGYLFARPLALADARQHLAVEAQNSRDRSTTA